MEYRFLCIRQYRSRQKRESIAIYQLYISVIKFHISKTEKKPLNSEAFILIHTYTQNNAQDKQPVYLVSLININFHVLYWFIWAFLLPDSLKKKFDSSGAPQASSYNQVTRKNVWMMKDLHFPGRPHWIFMLKNGAK